MQVNKLQLNAIQNSYKSEPLNSFNPSERKYIYRSLSSSSSSFVDLPWFGTLGRAGVKLNELKIQFESNETS
ncbi:hypothetical protein FKM82_011311 [Ascaphus truei]